MAVKEFIKNLSIKLLGFSIGYWTGAVILNTFFK